MCSSGNHVNVDDTKVDTHKKIVNTTNDDDDAVSKANEMKSNKSTTTTNLSQKNVQPWYKQGGMKEVNTIGMGINIVTTLVIITRNMPDSNFKSWLALLLTSYAISAIYRKSLYCIIVVPTFFTSLLLCTSLQNQSNSVFLQAQTILSIALCLAICKVNICMSVCLHRYAAHSAFKCGPITNFFVLALGCLAWQGGPIWWASQHRRHHKHCDIPGDPHSPLLDGTEQAFSFFERHADVDEEFAPNHIDSESTLMRLMDTWSWVFVFIELRLAHSLFGLEGLFVSFTSGWMCQAITLWFNVVNHPPDGSGSVHHDEDTKTMTTTTTTTTTAKSEKKKRDLLCKATDGKDTYMAESYIPFMILDVLHPLFSVFVKEDEHKHHHDHARLARRSQLDIAYWGFVWPMEQMGLVWNVIDS